MSQVPEECWVLWTDVFFFCVSCFGFPSGCPWRSCFFTRYDSARDVIASLFFSSYIENSILQYVLPRIFCISSSFVVFPPALFCLLLPPTTLRWLTYLLS